MFALSLLYNCIIGTTVLFLLLLNLSYDELTDAFGNFFQKKNFFFLKWNQPLLDLELMQ